MHWRFGLKIREQFTVSAFSVTVWQTSLHILIIVYWNKSGLIQTDATNDVVVNSFFGVTNNRVYNDVFHTFTFSMQQRESFVSTCITIWQKEIQDNSFNIRFQNWERSTIEKTILDNMGWILLFLYLFFLITTRIRDFLLDIDSAYKKFVWTATIWCNNNVSILLLYLYLNLLISGNFDDHRTLVRQAYILLLY
jgi:hypothetical protein